MLKKNKEIIAIRKFTRYKNIRGGGMKFILKTGINFFAYVCVLFICLFYFG